VIKPLDDKLLYLLPPDIEGFNLANKVCRECQRLRRSCPPKECQTWQKFDITKVKDVVFDEGAWEHLVLDSETKLLLEALVRVTDNATTTDAIITDVISGKGGGLISVLHGPPGTGKTLTAESIAERLHRPMYMVGFAELSTTPTDLEPNLQRILSLATAWDAVLLIDEADVFLEQRSLHELERNALVSVALRLLEYHHGVLFLTTNRIKTFDEAFLSRFSIAIKYHELDRVGRYAVWRKFFELAGCRIEGSDDSDEFTTVDASGVNISADELDELAEKPFNGRTIKNLVRTAQALALSQKKPLSAEHVKTVVRVQEKFLREFASTSLH
jgi:SpoVK/Ycf46/Vps4 family AAA+-type ATPase